MVGLRTTVIGSVPGGASILARTFGMDAKAAAHLAEGLVGGPLSRRVGHQLQRATGNSFSPDTPLEEASGEILRFATGNRYEERMGLYERLHGLASTGFRRGTFYLGASYSKPYGDSAWIIVDGKAYPKDEFYVVPGDTRLDRRTATTPLANSPRSGIREYYVSRDLSRVEFVLRQTVTDSRMVFEMSVSIPLYEPTAFQFTHEKANPSNLPDTLVINGTLYNVDQETGELSLSYKV